MSHAGATLVLLDSVLVKPAETLREVPAQGDGEDVDEAEQSERVQQHHGVLQEGQSCVGQEGISTATDASVTVPPTRWEQCASGSNS